MQIVILSGGSGSRLWPASNTQPPKPFIRMEDGLTLIQKTFIRVSNIKQVQNIIVITNYMYAERVKGEYAKISNSKSLPKLHLILEPMGKDTALPQ